MCSKTHSWNTAEPGLRLQDLFFQSLTMLSVCVVLNELLLKGRSPGT